MTKDELKNLGLTEEQITTITDGYKDYIPRTRFNEVNEAKKNAEALIKERDKQIEALKESSNASEDLKKQIEKLQADNKSAIEAKEAEIKQIKINNAVNTALSGAGAKNIKAVMALINLDNAELNDDGTVKGLNDQINALKGSDDTKFLFNDTTSNNLASFKGASPANSGNNANSGVTKEQFSKMGYRDRVKLYNDNKALYDELTKD